MTGGRHIIGRRRFLGGLLAVAAAPMIVRASSLMAHVPVRPPAPQTVFWSEPSEFTVWTVKGVDQYGRPVTEQVMMPKTARGAIHGRVAMARLEFIERRPYFTSLRA